LNKLWRYRWFLGKVTAVAAVLGVVIALLMGSQYTSNASLMPEYSTESMGSGTAQQLLDQYGGMLGIGGGTYASNSNAIRVELYPRIVESLNFQLKLAEREYYYPEYDTTASLFTYFDEIYSPSPWQYIMAYTVQLPFTVKGWVSDMLTTEQAAPSPMPGDRSEVLQIGREKMEVIEYLREVVSASLDQESGVISVQATMPGAQLSADVAKATVENLTSYLVEYRTQKIKKDLSYLREQHKKAQQRFFAIRDSLATFQDNNLNMVTARAQTEQQRLQSKYDLAYNLYNGLSQQLEQTKLRLQEQTPVFKTLNPVQVPTEKSSPNSLLIIIVCMLLGGIGSVGYLFARDWISENSFWDG
jgi:capsular polysaccharide biosynthesis protein